VTTAWNTTSRDFGWGVGVGAWGVGGGGGGVGGIRKKKPVVRLCVKTDLDNTELSNI
jgi:hypothetical protein